MTNEALKLAEEALNESRDDVTNTLNSYVDHPANERKISRILRQLSDHDAALAAVRAALAQQEAQGEPVAWCHIMYGEGQRLNGRLTWTAANPFGAPGKDYSHQYTVDSTPLYTHPTPAAVEPQVPAGWISVDDRLPRMYGQHVFVLTTDADDEPHAGTVAVTFSERAAARLVP